MRTERARTALWILTVYILSFLCYAPMLLRQCGVAVPDGLLYLRYGFVLTPLLVTGLFLLRGQGPGLTGLFRQITLKEFALCAAAGSAGVLVTGSYGLLTGKTPYGDAYPSAGALAVSCLYLLATAAVEEAAWRGFFFRRLAAGGKKLRAALLTGAVWGIWHIPMWTIRNALPPTEVLPLLVWVMLISIVLGLFYDRFRNLLSAALLHMLFNVCFLAPVGWNCAVLLCFVLTGLARYKKYSGNFPKPP